MRKLGLDVLLNKRVARVDVDQDNAANGMDFEDGERIECRCVMFAIGIKARDDLTKSAGLRYSDRGEIEIDRNLMTSEEDIYSIGACASWESQTFGLIQISRHPVFQLNTG